MMTGTSLQAWSTVSASLQAAVSSDSGGGGILQWIAYALLLSGVVFYAAVFLMYRNVHRRHVHTTDTVATLHEVRADDRLVGSVKGVTNARMKGANNSGGAGGALKGFMP